MATEKPKIWSGFWARLLAWFVDCLALSVVGYVFGMLASDYVAGWGSNGRAFGLVTGTLYFGVTASGLCGGRSLGMRLLKLKVVRLDGRPLGLPAAFGRALLLVGPMMLNGWTFDVQNPILVYIATGVAIVAVFGVSLAQIFLLLFNGPTRRLVHDIVFGSVVVRADVKAFEVPDGRAAAVVASALVLISLGLAIVGPLMLKTWAPAISAMVAPEQRVMDAVDALPEVREAGVMDNTNTFYGPSGPPQVTRTLIVTARVRKWPANANQELARIGATTVKTYRFAPGQQLMVKLVYGYDLGFASYSYSQNDSFSTQCTTPDVKCLAQ